MYLIIGTYTNAIQRTGLYLYHFDENTGVSELSTTLVIENPSYLAISKNRTIYVVSENEIPTDCVITAIRFDRQTQKLSILNKIPLKESAPCYISLNKAGTRGITANYLGGSLCVVDIEKDSTLKKVSQVIQFKGNSIHPERQLQSHLHCALYSPNGQYVFATDLGADSIYIFSTHDQESQYLQLQETITLKKGSGPRHLCFHPTKEFLYLINELSGTVNTFKHYNGKLKLIQDTVSDQHNAEGSADIQIHPNGKFLYTSNRIKEDGITIFSINEETGILTSIGIQKTLLHPRNILITPNGKLLLVAAKNSNIIQIFKINTSTGLLHNTKHSIKIDSPVCLKIMP